MSALLMRQTSKVSFSLVDRERLIKGLASRSSDDSIGWFFVPRDFLDELPINEAKNPRSIQPISAAAWNGTSAYNQAGTSGVAVMQLSVIDDQFSSSSTRPNTTLC